MDLGLWTLLYEKCEGTGGGGCLGVRGVCGRVRVRALWVQEQTPLFSYHHMHFFPIYCKSMTNNIHT